MEVVNEKSKWNKVKKKVSGTKSERFHTAEAVKRREKARLFITNKIRSQMILNSE